MGAAGAGDWDGGRTQRSDARRNRALLLAAAEAVIAERGVSATTDEIARRAGVGIGTLFRHFPTKGVLLAALLAEQVRRLADDAEVLAEEGEPTSAFFVFFARAVEQAATKRTFTELLAAEPFEIETAAPGLRPRLRGAIETLLARAREAGTVRADIALPEVLALLLAAGRAAEYAGEDRALRDRVVGVIVDGLRPVARD